MSRKPSKIKGGRLNLELSSQVQVRMEQLKDETGARTLTDIIGKALALYDFVWGKRRAGAKVLIQDSDGTRELLVL